MINISTVTIEGLNDEPGMVPGIGLYESVSFHDTLFMTIDGHIDDEGAIDLLVRFKNIDCHKWKRLYILCNISYMNPIGVIPFTYLLDRVRSLDGGIVLVSESHKPVNMFEALYNDMLVPFKCLDGPDMNLIIGEPVQAQIKWIREIDHAGILESIRLQGDSRIAYD